MFLSLSRAFNGFVHVIEVVIFVNLSFKLTVLGFITDAISKNNHAGNYIAALHVRDIVTFNSSWEFI